MELGTGPTLESARWARLIRRWAGALVAGVAGAAALASGGGVAFAAGEACTLSSQCTADPNAPICDSLTGGGCLGGAGACTNTCRKCSAGAECVARNPLTTVCEINDAGAREGQCVGCISNAQCQGPTPVCDVGTALCVGCLGSGDCQATGNPVCDQTNHQCVSCQSDFQPNNPGLFSCSNPDLPACQTTTEASAQGQCTQCSSTNPGVCPAKPDAPACDVSKGQCGCSTDAQCTGSPGAKTGRVCDVTANGGLGQCVPGCRVVGGVDNCPLGETCSAQDGGLGTCVGTTCTGDTDCTTAPRTHCDTTTTHTCDDCFAPHSTQPHSTSWRRPTETKLWRCSTRYRRSSCSTGICPEHPAATFSERSNTQTMRYRSSY